jgi:DNA-binding transcriptional ArsR family regulator
MPIDQPTSQAGARESEFVLLDRARLRALAHPLRVRLLALLRTHGPATATTLARRVGQSSGVTSYHLRQLEASGFIVDDPERGNRRERWWKSEHRGTRFDPADDSADPEVRELGEAYMRAVAGWYVDRMWTFLDSAASLREEMGAAWDDAWTMSDNQLALTAEESKELTGEINALLARYRDAEPGRVVPGTARVAVQWQVLPQVPEPIDDQDEIEDRS